MSRSDDEPPTERTSSGSGRRFEIVSPDFWPERAPRPLDAAKWRAAVVEAVPPRFAKLYLLAWVIAELARRDGFAFPSNFALAEMLDVAKTRVDDLLRQLEKLGLIFRAHVSSGPSGIQRRLWPTFPTSSAAPMQTARPSPRPQAQRAANRFPKSAFDSARLDAERRDGGGAARDLLAEIRGQK